MVPLDDPLMHWRVSRIHTIYEAPDGIHRGVDPWGEPIPSEMLRAYLVDLDGSHELLMPNLERVLLHRLPRQSHWWIKSVDDSYLAGIDRYKVA